MSKSNKSNSPPPASWPPADLPIDSITDAMVRLMLQDDAPVRKVQKNRSRCFSCRKKIGLTGLQCRCGYVFCALHRQAENHECDYDYKAAGRAQIRKDNPVVTAQKIRKI